MSQVKRIFVEKKDGFNVEAKQILWDLRHNLGVRSLTNLRFANRYDVAGLTDEEFAKQRLLFSLSQIRILFMMKNIRLIRIGKSLLWSIYPVNRTREQTQHLSVYSY